MTRTLIALLATTLTLPLTALDVGDPAPALDDASYITGNVPELTGNHWTVVEFWATWCPPCRKSIPHLTALQQQYPQELVVVGLSDEEQQTVRQFVDKMGNDMAYTVGIASDTLYQSYMADISGIPHAYLVNPSGEVVWHGHPMQLDQPLQAAMTGALEVDSFRKKLQLEQALEKSFESNDLAAIGRAAEALRLVDPNHEMAIGVLLQLAEQQENATAYRKVLTKLQIDQMDGNTANNLAWQLITHGDLQYRNLDIALTLAEHAVAAEPDAAHIADTRARAYMLLGKFDEAIVEQQRAIELDPDSESLQTPLEYYQQAKALAAGKKLNDNVDVKAEDDIEDIDLP
jgi:thiol-disulfide isomerase/thioredoxin/Flp pilus assembly protein TadD